MEHRDARRHLLRVARQDLVELLLCFRAEGEGHEFPRGAGLRSCAVRCANGVVEVQVLPGGPPGEANRSDPESGVSRAEQKQRPHAGDYADSLENWTRGRVGWGFPCVIQEVLSVLPELWD